MLAVWGISDSSVYAVGDAGSVLHYDGTDWNVMPTPTVATLRAVYGFSDSSVFACGQNGAILRYDGTDWTRMSSPIETSLYSLWGATENDLWTCGINGELAHYDGAMWTRVPSGTNFNLLSLWGSSATDIYAFGETTLHYDGSDWQPIPVRGRPDFNDVWTPSGSEVIAVGDSGMIVRLNASIWQKHNSGVTVNLNGVWGRTDVVPRYAVGNGGTILRLDDPISSVNWTNISPGYTVDLNAITGVSDSAIFVVGDGGTVLEYDGITWDSLAGLPTENLNDVWALDDNRGGSRGRWEDTPTEYIRMGH